MRESSLFFSSLYQCPSSLHRDPCPSLNSLSCRFPFPPATAFSSSFRLDLPFPLRTNKRHLSLRLPSRDFSRFLPSTLFPRFPFFRDKVLFHFFLIVPFIPSPTLVVFCRFLSSLFSPIRSFSYSAFRGTPDSPPFTFPELERPPPWVLSPPVWPLPFMLTNRSQPPLWTSPTITFCLPGFSEQRALKLLLYLFQFFGVMTRPINLMASSTKLCRFFFGPDPLALMGDANLNFPIPFPLEDLNSLRELTNQYSAFLMTPVGRILFPVALFDFFFRPFPPGYYLEELPECVFVFTVPFPPYSRLYVFAAFFVHLRPASFPNSQEDPFRCHESPPSNLFGHA